MPYSELFMSMKICYKITDDEGNQIHLSVSPNKQDKSINNYGPKVVIVQEKLTSVTLNMYKIVC